MTLVEMEQTYFNHSRRKRFRKTNRQGQEAFQAAQLRGIKVDSYIFRRKPLGIKTSECAIFFQMA
jgi:hypothetical protein